MKQLGKVNSEISMAKTTILTPLPTLRSISPFDNIVLLLSSDILRKIWKPYLVSNTHDVLREYLLPIFSLTTMEVIALLGHTTTRVQSTSNMLELGDFLVISVNHIYVGLLVIIIGFSIVDHQYGLFLSFVNVLFSCSWHA